MDREIRGTHTDKRGWRQGAQRQPCEGKADVQQPVDSDLRKLVNRRSETRILPRKL